MLRSGGKIMFKAIRPRAVKKIKKAASKSGKAQSSSSSSGNVTRDQNSVFVAVSNFFDGSGGSSGGSCGGSGD